MIGAEDVVGRCFGSSENPVPPRWGVPGDSDGSLRSLADALEANEFGLAIAPANTIPEARKVSHQNARKVGWRCEAVLNFLK
jgi:hypothetical protein